MRVLTYGTFDLFHMGHVKLLERLSTFGDEVYVGLSTDEFNLMKNKNSFFSYVERFEILNAIKFVNKVFPENNWEQKISDIKKYEIDIFIMGDDWEGEFDFLKEHCEVVYLPRTKSISTTEIKNKLSKISEDQIDEVEKTLDALFLMMKNIKKGI